jgi:hypothetical protein
MLAFWQSALKYVPREPPEEGWVVLTDPSFDPDGNRFCVVSK